MDKLSFIPKTSLSKTSKLDYKRAGLGLILKFSIFLFILSSVIFVGALFYKKIINRQIDDLSISLERAKDSFDTVFISEMEKLAVSIPVVEGLLSEHRLPSRIFDILESLTLKELEFSQFDYSHQIIEQVDIFNRPKKQGSGSSVIKVYLSGKAKNYVALAQQSEIFTKSDKIDSFSFSNFALTAGGKVSFVLEIIFNQSIFYAQ